MPQIPKETQSKKPRKKRRNIRNTNADAFLAYDNIHNIDYKVFRDVCKTFNHFVMKSMIDTGDYFLLPRRMGRLEIRKFKVPKGAKYVDFNETRKAGETIYHQNKHSDGWAAKFWWETEYMKAMFPSKRLFRWRPIKYYKLELAKAIKNKNTINKYYEFK